MRLLKIIGIIVVIGCEMTTLGQNIDDTLVYLFPGQGSDFRLFGKFEWEPGYKPVFMEYPVPDKNETLNEYAMRFVEKIDTNSTFILIGVSLGGMICSELSEVLKPEKTILISSAKTSLELPFRYRFQKKLPLYRLVPPTLMKVGALVLQPLVEPDRNTEKETFKAMLKAKNPVYLKRTVAMIINWDKKESNSTIYHIHGDNDHTLPIKKVTANAVVSGGSHMMTLTRCKDIEKLIK